MSRWIDAEKELKELKDMKVKGEVFTTAVNFAIRVIEEAPSIDLDETAEEIRFLEGLESKVLDKIKQADTPQPETQAETQNSNLTFEKRTMRDCYNCKRYETEGECIECHYEPKTEPQTEIRKDIPVICAECDHVSIHTPTSSSPVRKYLFCELSHRTVYNAKPEWCPLPKLFVADDEPKTEPQTEFPCDTCANKGDHDGECSNCFADSEPIRWKTPSHYKPKVEPQIDTNFTLTYTCCFSDCENFKHFGFGKKCIECKRKQKMWKTEPSDSENPNNCEDES